MSSDNDYAFPQHLVRGLGAAPGSTVQSRPVSPAPVHVAAHGTPDLSASAQLQARLPKGFSVVSMTAPPWPGGQGLLYLDTARSYIGSSKWPSGWISPNTVAKLSPLAGDVGVDQWATIKWDATGDILGISAPYVYLAGGPMYFIMALAQVGKTSQQQVEQAKKDAAAKAAAAAAAIASLPKGPIFTAKNRADALAFNTKTLLPIWQNDLCEAASRWKWVTVQNGPGGGTNLPPTFGTASTTNLGDDLSHTGWSGGWVSNVDWSLIAGAGGSTRDSQGSRVFALVKMGGLGGDPTFWQAQTPANTFPIYKDGFAYFGYLDSTGGAAATQGEPPGICILRYKHSDGNIRFDYCWGEH